MILIFVVVYAMDNHFTDKLCPLKIYNLYHMLELLQKTFPFNIDVGRNFLSYFEVVLFFVLSVLINT